MAIRAEPEEVDEAFEESYPVDEKTEPEEVRVLKKKKSVTGLQAKRKIVPKGFVIKSIVLTISRKAEIDVEAAHKKALQEKNTAKSFKR